MTPYDPAALEEDIEVLADWLARAEVVAPFTGAGISTESGVPDFRSPGSPWLANQPIPFDVFVASPQARREAWRRKFVMDDLYAGANRGVGIISLPSSSLRARHRPSSPRTSTACSRPPACRRTR